MAFYATRHATMVPEYHPSPYALTIHDLAVTVQIRVHHTAQVITEHALGANDFPKGSVDHYDKLPTLFQMLLDNQAHRCRQCVTRLAQLVLQWWLVVAALLGMRTESCAESSDRIGVPREWTCKCKCARSHWN